MIEKPKRLIVFTGLNWEYQDGVSVVVIWYKQVYIHPVGGDGEPDSDVS